MDQLDPVATPSSAPASLRRKPHGAVVCDGVGGRRKKLTYLVLSCCVKPQIKIH